GRRRGILTLDGRWRMADAGWALIVHGGAREMPDTERTSRARTRCSPTPVPHPRHRRPRGASMSMTTTHEPPTRVGIAARGPLSTALLPLFDGETSVELAELAEIADATAACDDPIF